MNKEEYSIYLETEHWNIVRTDALCRADYHCQLCCSTTNLTVHHNSYCNLYEETPADIIVLCSKCHEKHHNIKYENSREYILLKREIEKLHEEIESLKQHDAAVEKKQEVLNDLYSRAKSYR